MRENFFDRGRKIGFWPQFFLAKGNDMNTPKKKRKMVPMYSAEDFFSGKKNANPVGWMSDPDEPGPVILDRKTWEKLMGIRLPEKRTT